MNGILLNEDDATWVGILLAFFRFFLLPVLALANIATYDTVLFISLLMRGLFSLVSLA